MHYRAELFGHRQPLRVGVDIVDVRTERRAERRGVQPDRQAPRDQDAAIGGVQRGQVGLVRADRAPAVGNVV